MRSTPKVRSNYKRVEIDIGRVQWMYADGMSTYEIGRRLNISRTTIVYRLRCAGVKIRGRGLNKPTPRLEKRPCLKCQRPFAPAHKFNRMCARCTDSIKRQSGSLAPGWV